MDICKDFGKRNLPKLKITRYIYIFYSTDICVQKDLEFIYNELLNSKSNWAIRYYSCKPDITCHKMLQQINTPYYKYDKSVDKLCIIDKNNSIALNNIKMQIEYFQDTNCFREWLASLQTS